MLFYLGLPIMLFHEVKLGRHFFASNMDFLIIGLVCKDTKFGWICCYTTPLGKAVTVNSPIFRNTSQERLSAWNTVTELELWQLSYFICCILKKELEFEASEFILLKFFKFSDSP
jgi:hypothetical protein